MFSIFFHNSPQHRNPITVPVGIANAEEELMSQPKTLLASKYRNIVTYEVMEKVGHFAAYQAPEKLHKSFTGFVKKVENMATKNSKTEL